MTSRPSESSLISSRWTASWSASGPYTIVSTGSVVTSSPSNADNWESLTRPLIRIS